MGMKRPAEEDYNSNVHAKRSRDENGDGGPQLTLRFLLQSKVRLIDVCHIFSTYVGKVAKVDIFFFMFPACFCCEKKAICSLIRMLKVTIPKYFSSFFF